MRTDRQTDITKLIIAFRNLANMPKITHKGMEILQKAVREFSSSDIHARSPRPSIKAGSGTLQILYIERR
jgi:hypothetical protein